MSWNDFDTKRQRDQTRYPSTPGYRGEPLMYLSGYAGQLLAQQAREAARARLREEIRWAENV